jgi:hypothetical protein
MILIFMDVLEIPVLIFLDFISCFITETSKFSIDLLKVFVYSARADRGKTSGCFLYVT